jgi:TolB-like protein/Tfp pilus assembly protein PilF
MSDVFVSYKAEDRPRVRALASALEAEGLSLWWDTQIEGGAAWRHSIQEQLDAARCVVVVWSKRSVGPEGRFVHDEASRAQQRGVYLPILFDKVKPPLGFGETQALPLTGWRGDRADPRFQTLLAAIRAKIDPSGHVAVTAARRVDRRVLIAGGGVLAAGAVAAGGVFLLRPKAAASDSIAVMPFANLSGDPAQAYFSEGIAEELRSALARIAQLKVVARVSCEKVKDDEATQAAHKLGVANILTGSVRRSPNLIRISAQLVDGTNGVERWSQTYDRPPGDALEIQTGIAESVAQALKLQLAPAERKALAGDGTKSAVAHDLYLKAKAVPAGAEPEYRQALALLDAALAADPTYVAALAARSRTRLSIANFYETGPALKAGLTAQLADAQRAVELDPTSAQAQSALAAALGVQRDLAGSLQRHRLAYSLAPSDPDVIAGYSKMLMDIGRADQALPLTERAVARDPLNPRVYDRQVLALVSAGRYADAIQVGRRALAMGSKSDPLRAGVGDALVLSGQPAEALSIYEQVGSDWNRLRGIAIARAKMGDRAAADEALADFRKVDDGSLNFQFAEIYAQRGELDSAIASLEAADRAADPGLSEMRGDTLLDPLRSDPRYQALEARLKIPA